MRVAAVAVIAVTLLGCRLKTGPSPSDLTVEWAGADSGRFRARLDATHCAQTGILELIAVRGDTGVAGALFLADSARPAPGDYPIFPSTLTSEPRPGALAAMRWFNNTAIVAYEAIGGLLHLESRDSLLSGTLDLKMKNVERSDTLRLRGRFAGVPLTRADSSCLVVMRRNIL